MIYTSYDMIQDCRADKPEGWSYFITNYVPVIRKLLAHYGKPGDLDRVLLALRKADSSLFASIEPAPERWFLAELRQTTHRHTPADQFFGYPCWAEKNRARLQEFRGL